MVKMVSRSRSRTWRPTTTIDSSVRGSRLISSKTKTAQHPGTQTMKHRVSEILDRASLAPEEQRLHEVAKAIRALPDVVALPGPLVFRRCEHELHLGLTVHLEKWVQPLKQLEPLHLSIAPE